jgi:hypothetical protein
MDKVDNVIDLLVKEEPYVEKRDAKAELFAALAKAQGQILLPGKNSVAKVKTEKTEYSYKYTTLADFLDAIRKPFTENGLSIWQTSRIEGAWLTVYTYLNHASGQTLKAEFTVPCQGDAQRMGAALTYGRKYSLSLACGICGDEDDDSGGQQQPERNTQNKPAYVAKKQTFPSKPEPVEEVVQEMPRENFDAFVSWLGFLHIPYRLPVEVRDRLLPNMGQAYGTEEWFGKAAEIYKAFWDSFQASGFEPYSVETLSEIAVNAGLKGINGAESFAQLTKAEWGKIVGYLKKIGAERQAAA